MKRTHAPKVVLALWCLGWLAVLLAAFSTPASATEFSDDEITALKSGQVVIHIFPNSGKNAWYAGTGWLLIDAPPEEIWHAVMDWRSYTKMLLYAVESKQLARRRNKSVVRLKIGHPIFNLECNLELNLQKDANILRFQLARNLPAELEHLSGFWKMIPQGPERTLVAFAIQIRIPPGMDLVLPARIKNGTLIQIFDIPVDIKKYIESTPRAASAPPNFEGISKSVERSLK